MSVELPDICFTAIANHKPLGVCVLPGVKAVKMSWQMDDTASLPFSPIGLYSLHSSSLENPNINVMKLKRISDTNFFTFLSQMSDESGGHDSYHLK